MAVPKEITDLQLVNHALENFMWLAAPRGHDESEYEHGEGIFARDFGIVLTQDAPRGDQKSAEEAQHRVAFDNWCRFCTILYQGRVAGEGTGVNNDRLLVSERTREIVRALDDEGLATPDVEQIHRAARSIPTKLVAKGLGDASTMAHILESLTPGFNGPKTSANYYGFVTGGVFPIAEAADNVVTAFDQNVQVHLPSCSISTVVESRALDWLQQLLRLGATFEGKTFTTGATSANILGLACGRDWTVQQRLERRGLNAPEHSVAALGILGACLSAGVSRIQVLTTMGHSSLYKAASIVGIGRGSVKDVGEKGTKAPWRFDLELLRSELSRSDVASIVVVSCGEVNTGRYATDLSSHISDLRALCTQHGAWLHVDGAFGIFARTLPETPEFAHLRAGAAGMELADSITGDAHKCLNVPYDCGFFFSKSLAMMTQVCQNGNAPYLAPSAASGDSIPSPLNIGIENSRRFRALPVYAVLMSHGREGLEQMLARQVRLARLVARFVDEHEEFELLPRRRDQAEPFDGKEIGIIVLFRARDPTMNEGLVDRVNGSGEMYVSGTVWEGEKACRIAVSTWRVQEQRDMELIKRVLSQAVTRV